MTREHVICVFTGQRQNLISDCNNCL